MSSDTVPRTDAAATESDRPGPPGATPPPKQAGVWRNGPRWAWLAVAFGSVLMLFAVAVLGVVPAVISHYAGDITHSGGLGDAATGQTIDGPLNLLLVGIDERENDPEGGARADSIIVAHIPADHKAVYLASIPRDSLVDIPQFDDTGYPGGQDKINAAFEFGYRKGGGRAKGLELLADTVSGLADGLKFNGAAIINFSGLKSLIKAIGGVRLCVDEKVTSIHIGWNKETGEEGVPFVLNSDGTVAYQKAGWRPQVYWPGCHQFNDWQALDYARQRDLLANGDADYGRQRHQQQLIEAILQKTTSSGVITNPLKVNKVLNSIGDAVTFFNNEVPIQDWIFTLRDLRPGMMTMLKTNDGKFNPQIVDGVSYETLSDDSLALFKAMAADDVQSFVSAHPTWVTPRN